MDKIFNVQAKKGELDLSEVNNFLRIGSEFRVTKIVPLIQNVSLVGSSCDEVYSNYGALVVVSNH